MLIDLNRAARHIELISVCYKSNGFDRSVAISAAKGDTASLLVHLRFVRSCLLCDTQEILVAAAPAGFKQWVLLFLLPRKHRSALCIERSDHASWLTLASLEWLFSYFFHTEVTGILRLLLRRLRVSLVRHNYRESNRVADLLKEGARRKLYDN
ncbi:hypothetical protein K7X08_001818 [Anisodus acutangulus]|uniref:Uncharacterized protein n=1 Tax=Anisodus acutangulus TaxID=402998 RepID=A0A9Q1LRS0_9SOLA|nr:hypothetical protein K7X08_001818 [Anisodus acutangulus]